MNEQAYDVIVVGAGHAGCEASYISAKLGSKTLLITLDMNKIAQMSCNPAVGGIAKGQIVREIDAMGGAMGRVTDIATIQFRMLNVSKGPAMWSPRAQCDRILFSQTWRSFLEHSPNLDIWQDEVDSLLFSGSEVSGVHTKLGMTFISKTVIITAGTFLNGKIFIGSTSVEAGRIGEPSAKGLTSQLIDRGIIADRMKTGTPPRIDIRSVNVSSLPVQKGDSEPRKFSYALTLSAIQRFGMQRDCYMVYTNSRVHDILKSGFQYSPLFNGLIHGKGPRYCPSIEDKLKTFADKEQHQLFLEPEGWNTNEYYLQGFSSSLPLDIQYQALKQISGFENVKIYRPAYAIEYDYFPPTQISHSLEVKNIPNLYFAGQVNGTTGYEEAAAQGLVAGINAHRKCHSLSPLILGRDQAYIGVLIDDLVTKGVDEPYRMFTSRAEYRILLRQDNADERLTPLAHEIGSITDEEYSLFEAKHKAQSSLIELLDITKVKASDSVNDLLSSSGTSTLNQSVTLSSLLGRPQLSLSNLFSLLPNKSHLRIVNTLKEEIGDRLLFDSVPRGTYEPYESFTRSQIGQATSNVNQEWGNNAFNNFLQTIYEYAEVMVKYRGYIERERALADKLTRLENVKIPANFDFSKIESLSIESRQKLSKVMPVTIGQASRISGVSPSDISVLLLYLGR